ncbi:hypothetical protein P775_05140 [Puniceibacterium antarcticum]|uniref:Glucose-methanol-choline oxidoreductase N-terminal domain-containing protein n=1 Tax=Puniceibacterium antarcticum TaxID=1206336 RepID=A0A2G8RII1_9RHOB|nr:hypothetical protein P775_05140 [Puniceibacterium antarcticum]
MATVNLTLRPFFEVRQVLYYNNRKRATGVEVVDAETNKTYQYTADVIFLNASTFNSTWLLMNSATDVWEGGLGSASEELGHNAMDHNFRVGAEGSVEGFDDKYYFDRCPAGFYIPRFRNVDGEERPYLRGFGYQGSASREGWNREIAELNIGKDLKNALSTPGSWRIGMTAFGEMLPDHANRIALATSLTDKWGLPVLSISVELSENEKKMRSAAPSRCCRRSAWSM